MQLSFQEDYYCQTKIVAVTNKHGRIFLSINVAKWPKMQFSFQEDSNYDDSWGSEWKIMLLKFLVDKEFGWNVAKRP